MNPDEHWESLWTLLRSGKTSFIDPVELGPSHAFHYTHRAAEIVNVGRLRGADLTPAMGFTQEALVSPPALNEHGVIFAYADEAQTFAEGGARAQVLRISFRRAISAIHEAEAGLEDDFADWLRMFKDEPVGQGHEDVRTILILADDVLAFEILGTSSSSA